MCMVISFVDTGALNDFKMLIIITVELELLI